MSHTTQNTLKKIFGYEAFRPGQEAVFKALQNNKNALFITPTGSGKSLVYQLLAAEGHKVIVISPLIALMDDQVFQARQYGLFALCLHSQMGEKKREKAQKDWAKAMSGLLFVTPERFFKQGFRQMLEKTKTDCLVVDEAHCVSQWGHDFRPDYSKVGEIRAFLKNPLTLCCTATAPPQTRQDILKVVGLEPERTEVFVHSVLRSNLTHQHIEALDYKEKLGELKKLNFTKSPTIIYFSLIKTLEQVAQDLDSLGVSYTKYHSKIQAQNRYSNQKSFIKGECNLMLATPAFGLGVDKQNIRNLIHFELPGSIEAYVQEFGRAGRDNKPAKCVTLYSQEDIALQMDFIKWGHPGADILRWVHRQIGNTKELGFPEHQLFELKKKMHFYNTHDFRLESSINILLRWGCLEKRSRRYFVGQEPLESVPDIQNDLSEKLIKIQQKKLLDLLQLIRSKDQKTFHKVIKDYFGEGDSLEGHDKANKNKDQGNNKKPPGKGDTP